jgi:hypothetical protein
MSTNPLNNSLLNHSKMSPEYSPYTSTLFPPPSYHSVAKDFSVDPSAPYSAFDPNRPYLRPSSETPDRFSNALTHGVRKAFNVGSIIKDLLISGLLTLPLWLFGLHIPIVAVWTIGKMAYRFVKGALEGYSAPPSFLMDKHHKQIHDPRKNPWL